MLPGLVARPLLFTDECKIVVSVRVMGLESHGPAQMLAGGFELPDFLEDAALNKWKIVSYFLRPFLCVNIRAWQTMDVSLYCVEKQNGVTPLLFDKRSVP